MPAKPHYAVGADPWVAARDEPHRQLPGCRRLGFVRSSSASTTVPDDATRYDTQAEALAAAQAHWPQRTRGYRVVAMRIEDARATVVKYHAAEVAARAARAEPIAQSIMVGGARISFSWKYDDSGVAGEVTDLPGVVDFRASSLAVARDTVRSLFSRAHLNDDH